MAKVTLTITPFPVDVAGRRADSGAAGGTGVDGAQEITDAMSADSVMGKVRLYCDDNTAVVMFRKGGKLYLTAVDRASA